MIPSAPSLPPQPQPRSVASKPPKTIPKPPPAPVNVPKPPQASTNNLNPPPAPINVPKPPFHCKVNSVPKRKKIHSTPEPPPSAPSDLKSFSNFKFKPKSFLANQIMQNSLSQNIDGFDLRRFKDLTFNHVLSVSKLSTGSSLGTMIVVVPEGKVVIKSSTEFCSELFSNNLASLLNIPNPRVTPICYGDPLWRNISRNSLLCLLRQQGISNTKGISQHSELLQKAGAQGRSFDSPSFLIFEYIHPEKVVLNSSFFYQIGKIMSFDMLLNNSDRFPFKRFWPHTGNFGNILMNNGIVYAIDNVTSASKKASQQYSNLFSVFCQEFANSCNTNSIHPLLLETVSKISSHYNYKTPIGNYTLKQYAVAFQNGMNESFLYFSVVLTPIIIEKLINNATKAAGKLASIPEWYKSLGIEQLDISFISRNLSIIQSKFVLVTQSVTQSLKHTLSNDSNSNSMTFPIPFSSQNCPHQFVLLAQMPPVTFEKAAILFDSELMRQKKCFGKVVSSIIVLPETLLYGNYSLSEIGQFCKSRSVSILFTFVDKLTKQNCSQFLYSDGTTACMYSKQHLLEIEKKSLVPGNRYSLFTLDNINPVFNNQTNSITKASILICHDMEDSSILKNVISHFQPQSEFSILFNPVHLLSPPTLSHTEWRSSLKSTILRFQSSFHSEIPERTTSFYRVDRPFPSGAGNTMCIVPNGVYSCFSPDPHFFLAPIVSSHTNPLFNFVSRSSPLDQTGMSFQVVFDKCLSKSICGFFIFSNDNFNYFVSISPDNHNWVKRCIHSGLDKEISVSISSMGIKYSETTTPLLIGKNVVVTYSDFTLKISFSKINLFNIPFAEPISCVGIDGAKETILVGFKTGRVARIRLTLNNLVELWNLPNLKDIEI